MGEPQEDTRTFRLSAYGAKGNLSKHENMQSMGRLTKEELLEEINRIVSREFFQSVTIYRENH